MADLTCNIESTLHDARPYYPRRRGHLNSLANIRFRSESSRERHFCNDGYTSGELDVVVDNFDYVALRDTLWAAKNVMVDNYGYGKLIDDLFSAHTLTNLAAVSQA